MTTTYRRRVSFDSLSPFMETPPDEPLHIPLQYLPEGVIEEIQTHRDNTSTPTKGKESSSRTTNHGHGHGHGHVHGLDLNYGFAPASRSNDPSKILGAYVNGTLDLKAVKSKSNRRKCPKLPPPPDKSSLKRHTGSYLLSSNGDNSNGDSLTTPRSYTASLSLVPATSIGATERRKRSLVGLTNEQLLAMDQQFRKGVDPESLKFGGDGYLPIHGASAGAIDTRRANKVKDIDKFVGTVANNKKVLGPSLNYNSYATCYRHKDMSNFIKNYLIDAGDVKRTQGDTIEDKLQNIKVPESLREIIVYISGRRHTWSALDWTLKNFLQGGDNLVIIAQIPEFVAVDPLLKYGDDSSDSADDDKYDPKSVPPPWEFVDVEEHYGATGIQDEAQRMADYVFTTLDKFGRKDLKVSFTVELIKEKVVSSMLKQAIALHRPEVFICSTLASRLFVPLGRHTRLPFYVTEKIKVPSIVIPDRLIERRVLDNIEDEDESTNKVGISCDIHHHPKKDQFLDNLNKFTDSLDPTDGADFVITFPSSRSNSNSNSRSNSRSPSTSADSPTEYFPKIKFSDNLQVPTSSSGGGSGRSSRRNSNNSTGIYKVKSLLDSEPDPVMRSKSYNSPMTGSISNGSTPLEKTNTKTSIKKVKSEPQQQRKSSGGFLSFFKKKK